MGQCIYVGMQDNMLGSGLQECALRGLGAVFGSKVQGPGFLEGV